MIVLGQKTLYLHIPPTEITKRLPELLAISAINATPSSRDSLASDFPYRCFPSAQDFCYTS
jgi:hypothetical protein